MPNHNYEVRVAFGVGPQATLWRALGTPDGAGVAARHVFAVARDAMNEGTPLAIDAGAGKLLDDAAIKTPSEWTEVVLQGPDGMFERAVREVTSATAKP